MKILIINYRYFISGGPERYMFNLSALLEERGHTVIPFSIRYSKNHSSEYKKYFVQPLSTEDEVYFNDQTWTIRSFFKTLERAFYSHEVYRNLSSLIRDTRPDFAIVLKFGKLSPSVLNALLDQQVPFSVRLSDFGMICANEHMFRNGKICELCVKENSFNSVKHRCVHNSTGVSVVKYLASQFHKHMGYFDKIDSFIIPSKFTLEKMVEAGYPRYKLIHVPTFVQTNGIIGREKKNQILYVGRIERIKGVQVLLSAIKKLSANSIPDFECVVAGFGSQDYVDEQKKLIENSGLKNIRFTGYVDKKQIDALISESLFTVAPSIWYDNMPNSVLESLALGTPVIASNHGCFPELVIHGQTGLLFKAGDVDDLAEKMNLCLNDRHLCLEYGSNAVKFINDYHSPETHYGRLMELCSRSVAKDQF